jgi:hypothetical protein
MILSTIMRSCAILLIKHTGKLKKSGLPSDENSYLEDYIFLIVNSLRKLANIEIVDSSLSIEEQAKQVFNAGYVLLAHNASDDPIFNYANQTALRLFEMSWEEFTKMPSKYSAESDERGKREKFIAEVEAKGYSNDYSGIRISKTGRRFEIKNVILWNVYDLDNKRIGQAALFDEYSYL